jgi:hypothetical protein
MLTPRTREFVEEMLLVSDGEQEAVSGGVPVCTGTVKRASGAGIGRAGRM